MAELTNRDLHVDQLLTDMSVAYRNGTYIADKIAPLVPVTRQSNIVPKYDQSHWFRNRATSRAPGSSSQRGGFTTDNTDTYFALRKSFGFEIPDELRDNQDSPYMVDRDATMFVSDKMMMVREVDFATDFFTTSVWGTDKVGSTDFTQWSNYAASSPLVDVTTYKDTVEALVGTEPNTMVIGKQVWVQLKWHPDLVDTIKYTQRAQLGPDLVASLFELDNLYIGRAIQTTTMEGTAESSVSYTRIWGKHALLAYVTPSPSLMSPSAIYTFVWQRVPNALQYIKRMRNEEREIDIIEGNTYYDQKVVASRSGVFLQNAVA